MRSRNLWWKARWLLADKEEKQQLKQNFLFKNKYAGERCFILGNGPSMKDQDLSLLENEYVFGVNQCSRNRQFNNVRLNFYVCTDYASFGIDPDYAGDDEFLDVLKSLNGGSKPVCFFHYWFKNNLIEKYGLDKILNVRYIDTILTYCEGLHGKIDLTHYIYSCGTVVQEALQIAVYMGFKEIYLLGCDNTGIMTSIKAFLHDNVENYYSYAITESEKQRMQNKICIPERSMEILANGYAETFKGYRRWFKYCENRGIKLVNCSPKTVIDCIPKMDLETVLGKE